MTKNYNRVATWARTLLPHLRRACRTQHATRPELFAQPAGL